MTFEKCKALIAEAISELESVSEKEINELGGKPMLFRLGEREMPFTTNAFLTSFSIPVSIFIQPLPTMYSAYMACRWVKWISLVR